MNDTVAALALWRNDVYAGGYFTMAGGGAANCVARWSSSSWSALGSGMGGGSVNNPPSVSALALLGTNIYAGGSFITSGESPANRIARWDGSSWSALGSGINSNVYALAVSGTNLYAGGAFRTAGGRAADRIARWNGSKWSALGSGMDNNVFALAVSGDELYAGGDFIFAGNTNAGHVAKWNGNSWSALGSGVNSSVYALAVSGSNVYAGGTFSMAGGTTANSIAKWDGSSWSALGSGMNNAVWALAVSGEGDLYAGGWFTRPANQVAQWRWNSWWGLGSGVDAFYQSVYALAISGSDLFAAGTFTSVDGRPANLIAKWNGNGWRPLGSGITAPNDFAFNGGSVAALAISGSDLYAGGKFMTAGGKISAYVAHAYLERPTLSILRSGTDFTLSWPTFYDTFALQQNPNAANSNTWSTANYPLTTNGSTKTATVPITSTNQFFRLIGN